MGLFGKRKPEVPRVTIAEACEDVAIGGMALNAQAAELFAELADERPKDALSMSVLAHLIASGLAADLVTQGLGADGLILEVVNDGREFAERLGVPPPIILLRLTRRMRNLLFTAGASAVGVPPQEQAAWLHGLGVGSAVAGQLTGPEPMYQADPLVRQMWFVAGMSDADRAINLSTDALEVLGEPDLPWRDGFEACFMDFTAQAVIVEMISVGVINAHEQMTFYGAAIV